MNHLDDQTFLREVGNKIRQHRKSKKLTLLDVAIKANLEENAVQRVETGRINSTLKTLLKIATALEIEFKELFDFSIYKKPL